MKILRLVAEGKQNSEIAAEARLSIHTINHHLQRIFKRLGVRNRAEATREYWKGTLQYQEQSSVFHPKDEKLKKG